MKYSIVRVNTEARGQHDSWTFKAYREGEVVFKGTCASQNEGWDKIKVFFAETTEEPESQNPFLERD